MIFVSYIMNVWPNLTNDGVCFSYRICEFKNNCSHIYDIEPDSLIYVLGHEMIGKQKMLISNFSYTNEFLTLKLTGLFMILRSTYNQE